MRSLALLGLVLTGLCGCGSVSGKSQGRNLRGLERMLELAGLRSQPQSAKSARRDTSFRFMDARVRIDGALDAGPDGTVPSLDAAQPIDAAVPIDAPIVDAPHAGFAPDATVPDAQLGD